MSTTCKCGAPARPKSRYCWSCHAAYMRLYRATHFLSPEARLKMNCRSYTHVHLKRGKLSRLPCRVCGNPNSEAHHEDYSKPLEVQWLCRTHHLELDGQLLRKEVPDRSISQSRRPEATTGVL